MIHTLSTLAVLIAFSEGGMGSVTDTNPSPEQVEVERIRVGLDRLTHVLSGIAPVRAVQPSLIGTAPNFIGVNYCWSFDNVGPDVYQRVEQVIKNFHGNMRWSFNPQFQSKRGVHCRTAEWQRILLPNFSFNIFKSSDGERDYRRPTRVHWRDRSALQFYCV